MYNCCRDYMLPKGKGDLILESGLTSQPLVSLQCWCFADEVPAWTNFTQSNPAAPADAAAAKLHSPLLTT